MGSEGETSDLDLPIYVAVGRNVEKGKSLLDWTVKNFMGRNIYLLHIHQPTSLVSRLSGKLSAITLKNQTIKACQELERLKMQKLMNEYLHFLSQKRIQADKVWIEMSSIEKGILQLISQHGIKWLVMGAPETFNDEKLSEVNSTKSMIVYQQAPLSCHVCFVSKGRLILEQHGNMTISGPVDSSHLTTFKTTAVGKILAGNPKENMETHTGNAQYIEEPTRSIEEVDTVNPPSPVGHMVKDNLPLLLKVDLPEDSLCSSSDASLDCEYQRKGAYNSQLTHDDENYESRAFEESLRRWRAEQDALVAVHKAEASENRCKEEIKRCKEIEELLLRQRQEIETMKIQHDKSVKDLQLIHERKPLLESQLREAYCSEKELEDKLIQAVNLLITFRETRDKLQIHYDSSIRQINRYRALQPEDPWGISIAHFFGISFSEIIEATQNFGPSQKIGEGRYGSVFKGILLHINVAIWMLPASGSQSDLEFKNETEVLSRVRHPNLVTLIGACPESRSLIYEYIENGSLEDYLSGPAKTRPLSWQTRIRVAIEICSTLVFLQANNSCRVHGNLKPSNILFDANFAIKISGFGIFNLIPWNENLFSCSKNDPENLVYVDPEVLENGELTPESDVYSFGIVILRLLTARLATGVVRDVKCALEKGLLDTVLDMSAGVWPLAQAKELASLALRCCHKDRLDRPDLESEVWPVLKPMRELCNSSQWASTSSSMDSRSQRKIPSHFVCPIYQEIMKDPHIAPDGFTYEADAIKGWFNSGHKTSPMTNLRLENCNLVPNYALYYAIQEWQQNT